MFSGVVDYVALEGKRLFVVNVVTLFAICFEIYILCIYTVQITWARAVVRSWRDQNRMTTWPTLTTNGLHAAPGAWLHGAGIDSKLNDYIDYMDYMGAWRMT